VGNAGSGERGSGIRGSLLGGGQRSRSGEEQRAEEPVESAS
jgi:hypothetical protein